MIQATLQPFVISRTFDAPREALWKAWTDAGHMGWWGPKGVTIIRPKIDLRPGGTFHYGMKTPDGNTMWGKWVLREIAAPDHLVFINSFSDEAGGITRHPMSPTWPLEILSAITFAGHDGNTTVTIEWLPWNATDIESKTFDENRESMKNGWSGSLDSLAEHLAQA
jgi:uncharacterized protein YndB with AHSA1/START domain